MLLQRNRKCIRYALCMFAYRGSLSWTVLCMLLVKECIVTIACYSSMLVVQRLRNCACEIQLADILVLFPAVRYMPQCAVKNKYCADVF